MTLNGRMTVTTAVACVLASTALLPLFSNSPVVRHRYRRGDRRRGGRGADPAAHVLPRAVCLAASVASLLLYLNLVFEARHSLLFVIPTPASLGRLFELVGTGINDSSEVRLGTEPARPAAAGRRRR